jgi:hypothetical protein
MTLMDRDTFRSVGPAPKSAVMGYAMKASYSSSHGKRWQIGQTSIYHHRDSFSEYCSNHCPLLRKTNTTLLTSLKKLVSVGERTSMAGRAPCLSSPDGTMVASDGPTASEGVSGNLTVRSFPEG